MSKQGAVLLVSGAMAVAGAIWATPALAHPGSHHGMNFSALIGHFATGWHSWPLIAAAAAGLAIYAIGQRRARAASQRRARQDRQA